MGRVVYMRHIVPEQLEAYEALGWELVGGKSYALDGVSLCMEWSKPGDPVEPQCRYEYSQPKPLARVPWGTRDLVKWSFAPLDLVIVIALAVAGLFWGFVDKVMRR